MPSNCCNHRWQRHQRHPRPRNEFPVCCLRSKQIAVGPQKTINNIETERWADNERPGGHAHCREPPPEVANAARRPNYRRTKTRNEKITGKTREPTWEVWENMSASLYHQDVVVKTPIVWNYRAASTSPPPKRRAQIETRKLNSITTEISFVFCVAELRRLLLITFTVCGGICPRNATSCK